MKNQIQNSGFCDQFSEFGKLISRKKRTNKKYYQNWTWGHDGQTLKIIWVSSSRMICSRFDLILELDYVKSISSIGISGSGHSFSNIIMLLKDHSWQKPSCWTRTGGLTRRWSPSGRSRGPWSTIQVPKRVRTGCTTRALLSISVSGNSSGIIIRGRHLDYWVVTWGQWGRWFWQWRWWRGRKWSKWRRERLTLILFEFFPWKCARLTRRGCSGRWRPQRPHGIYIRSRGGHYCICKKSVKITINLHTHKKNAFLKRSLVQHCCWLNIFNRCWC